MLDYIGKKVEVYRNLHKNCISVRYKGRVVDHVGYVVIDSASFAVQPAGHRRCVREGRKNVHAFVRGIASSSGPIDETCFYLCPEVMVNYNPYVQYDMDAPTFSTRGGDPVSKAKRATVTTHGVHCYGKLHHVERKIA